MPFICRLKVIAFGVCCKLNFFHFLRSFAAWIEADLFWRRLPWKENTEKITPSNGEELLLMFTQAFFWAQIANFGIIEKNMSRMLTAWIFSMWYTYSKKKNKTWNSKMFVWNEQEKSIFQTSILVWFQFRLFVEFGGIRITRKQNYYTDSMQLVRR